MKVSCVVLVALLLQLCNGSPTGSAKRKEEDKSLGVLNYVPADGVQQDIPWYRISKDGDIPKSILTYNSQGYRFAEDFYPRIRKRRFLEDIFDKAKDGIKKTGRKIKEGARKLGKKIKYGAKKVKEHIKKGAKKLKEKAKKIGGRIKEGTKKLKEKAKKIGGRIKEGTRKLKEKIKKFWGGR